MACGRGSDSTTARFAFLDRHLDRLYGGARAIGLDIGLSREALTDRLYETTRANDMTDAVHVRLMVTRGEKKTPSQHPSNVIGGPTIVIIAEHKTANPDVVHRGISLFTATIRRPPPDTLDQRLNCHSKLHEVIALIQATHAGADEALMLDPTGAVATCNATNFFCVRQGQVWTSTGHYSLPGITRALVLETAAADGIPTFEAPFSLTDVYGADEAFVTGTFGGLTPRHRGRRASDRHRIARADDRPSPRPLRTSAGRRVPRVRICCWSGPRNISTALMYSFAQRTDTTVVDEPLYAHYLRVTGRDHPGREDVLRRAGHRR